jgi:hypothetical protein
MTGIMDGTIICIICGGFLFIVSAIAAFVVYERSKKDQSIQPRQNLTTTPPNNTSGGGIEKYIPRSLWPAMVAPAPDRDIDPSERPYFSSYDLFIQACSKYPDFGTHPDSVIARREICAFFGNLKQETHFVINREQSCLNTPCDWISKPQRSPLCQGSWQACGFYGRGPIQTTHHYNYSSLSKNVYGDDTLLKDPDLVAKKADLGWQAALFFWFDSKIHDEMIKSPTSPFKISIEKINGALECGKSTPGGLNRVKYFKEYCKLLNVEPGPEADLVCW